MDGRPDLVLIMTEQQRFDQVGYASDGHFETPTIDRLAARGVVFENAYSASTTCVQARVALLTGLQPHRVPTQVTRFALREGFWTVARALRDAGYETALMGKMDFAPVHAEHGFETMRLCEHLRMEGPGSLRVHERRDVFDDYHDWLLASGLDDWRVANRPSRRNGTEEKPGFPYGVDVHPTGWVEREAVSFLERRDRRRPLFLVVSFPHPHTSYDPPEPYASMYDPGDSQLPPSGFEVNDGLPEPFRNAMMGFGRMKLPRVDPHNDWPLRKFIATVRGAIRHIDDAVGQVVERLDLERTVVFFTSDHGEYAGHRGLFRTVPWIPFDDLARVPLMVAGGDIVAPRREQQLVQSFDFVPTCLDYAGVPAPAGVSFDSRSLRPLLSSCAESAGVDRTVFSATSMGWPMVRRDRFKYILHKDSSTCVLFDLGSDPSESVNLWGVPPYAHVGDELSALLSGVVPRPVLTPVGLLRNAGRFATAPLRTLPDFLIIGAQRCGTTSVFQYLVGHPGVRAPIGKELHFFDLRYRWGRLWYRSRFPLRHEFRRGRRLLTGEASPYYLFHPLCAERAHATVPGARLLVLLRNPTDRAFSHYQLEVAAGRERLGFEEALACEAERLAGEEARILRGEVRRDAPHQSQSYLARGRYADQLERWFAYFPRDQFLVLRAEDVFAAPETACRRILDFLGLEPAPIPPLSATGASGPSRLDPTTRRRLDEQFAEANERLFQLVGIDFRHRDAPRPTTTGRAP